MLDFLYINWPLVVIPGVFFLVMRRPIDRLLAERKRHNDMLEVNLDRVKRHSEALEKILAGMDARLKQIEDKRG
jgi:hypothetical protein